MFDHLFSKIPHALLMVKIVLILIDVSNYWKDLRSIFLGWPRNCVRCCLANWKKTITFKGNIHSWSISPTAINAGRWVLSGTFTPAVRNFCAKLPSPYSVLIKHSIKHFRFDLHRLTMVRSVDARRINTKIVCNSFYWQTERWEAQHSSMHGSYSQKRFS